MMMLCRQPDHQQRVSRARRDNNNNSSKTDDQLYHLSEVNSGAQASRDQVGITQEQEHEQEQQLELEQQEQKQWHRNHDHLAPLASLDCSITESTISPNGSPAGCGSSLAAATATATAPISTTTIDTPTLRGYFDCDELSDMVDDSLFEITNAGCLSKSVFSKGQCLYQVVLKQGEEEEEEEEDYDRMTPTNEIKECSTLATKPEITSINSEPIKQEHPIECMIIDEQAKLAKSSVSNPVRQTGASGKQSLLGTGNRKLRSQSARGSSSATKMQQGGDIDRVKTNQVCSGGKQVASSSASSYHQIKTTRRKTRSNPDVRVANEDDSRQDNEKQSTCITCNRLRHLDETSQKKKGKKRFTFSLFNLFGSASTNDDSNQSHCKCAHKFSKVIKSNETDNNDRFGTNGHKIRGGPDDELNGIYLKSRDSIRLTNQRKQRHRQQRRQQTPRQEVVRSSRSLTNFQAPSEQASSTTEVLLDFPASRVRSSDGQIRNSRDIDRSKDKITTSILIGQYDQNQRPAKSVKFTTPDRVLILPGKGRLSGSIKKSASSQFCLPPHDLKPSAPIIKKPMVKTSTYVQTESNKNLNDLLKQYENNNDLITEISEKLKLTEVIASPKSILDIEQDNSQNNNSNQISDTSTSAHTDIDSTNVSCDSVDDEQQTIRDNISLSEDRKSDRKVDPPPPASKDVSYNGNVNFSSEWIVKQLARA